MKCKTLIKLIVLGILTGMSSIVCARDKIDSLILQRIYDFEAAHTDRPDSVEDNLYVKFRFNVERRNPTLWLIPTLYVMAKEEREYIRESYNHVTFLNSHKIEVNQQTVTGTIRRNRKAMPTLVDLATPNIYDVAIFDGYMLSPFNRHNRRYYRYTQHTQDNGTTRLDFKPRIYNTQLLNGYAIIDSESGHILRTVLNGEFDMISFRTEIQQSPEDWPLPTPRRGTTAATFNFAGNRITTLLSTAYNCPTTLTDSAWTMPGRELMDSIRPIPLSETDKQIYAKYDRKHQPDTTRQDTVTVSTSPSGWNLMKKIFWDTIGDNLVTPIAAEAGSAYFRLSPIINPLYLSYSHRRGLSYKMKLRSRYRFSPHRYLTLNPTFGYNFKIRQFYFTAPLRMTYNPKRNGYAEIIYGNGNRISNGSVAEVIQHEHRDTLDFTDRDMDKFNDNHLFVFNNIMLFDWLDIEAGLVYHQRKAVNKDLMRFYSMPIEYRSTAPMIGLKLRPWQQGPVFSIDWERAFKSGKPSKDYTEIDYERWEFDASWKHALPGLRLLNLRTGAGLYTHRAQNYFVDYANFRDNNLPEGWDDDWSGNFQLLNGQWYNESNYYIRGNISYESPLLIATWVPYLGKYIEKERFYASTVFIQHTRPYFELGYGFTNRYVSVGAFASFLNGEFREVGCKFEFELFRRW